MFNDARRLVHAVHVDLGQELEQRRLVRVHFPAVDLQRVYPVLEGGLWVAEGWLTPGNTGKNKVKWKTHPGRPNDHACPVREGHVIVVLEAPRNGAVADTLLALLQLLQQAKVAWHHCGGDGE